MVGQGIKVGILPLQASARAGRTGTTDRVNTLFGASVFGGSPDMFGVRVVADALARHREARTVFVDANDAHGMDVLLVPLVSTMSVYDMVRTMRDGGLEPGGRPIIIMGGAGCVNVRPIERYADAFVFGRGEAVVGPLVDALLDGGRIPPGCHAPGRTHIDDGAAMLQAEQPYPHDLDGLREVSIGCPRRCRFCHYSYARKSLGDAYRAPFTGNAGSTTPESTFDALTVTRPGHYTTAIDGFSQRLRMAFHKKITDDDIVSGIVAAAECATNKRVSLKVYQLVGLPTETHEERIEFFALLGRVGDRVANRDLYIHFMTSVFHPDPLTPASRMAVDLSDWRAKSREYTDGHSLVLRRGRFQVFWPDNVMAGPLTVLKYVVANRAWERDAPLVEALAGPQRGNASAAVARVMYEWPAVRDMVRQFEPDEPMAADYLRSYTHPDTLAGEAARLAHELRTP